MQSPPRRRWLRFQLRTLLIVVAIVAVPLAWVASERRQASHEQQLAVELEKLGFAITLGGVNDFRELRANNEPQGWWRDLTRRVLGERVLGVMNRDAPLYALTQLAEFPNLQELWLTGVNANDLAPLAGLTDLEVLLFAETPVGATPISDLTPIAGLTKLRELTVMSAEVRDLAPISGLVHLRFLQLSYARCRDFSPLSGMRKLELLDLDNSEVRDLSPLAGLTSLDCLSLNNTSVSDLAPLAKVPNLRKIWVRNTGVTKDQVDALQKAMPNCKIDHDPFP
jgi:hypothetical protein